MRVRKFLNLFLSVALLGVCFFIPKQLVSQQWLPVRRGIQFGISGMALVEQQSDSLSFLIVHDNKKEGEGRLAIATIKGKEPPKYVPLNWSRNTKLPEDLEALTSVPGKSEASFMALASAGKIYHLKLGSDNQNVSVLKVLDLPGIPKGSNFEAFDLHEFDGKLVAVWAHRGQDEDPAVIYWGLLDLTKYQISLQGSATLKVPWPVGSIRHISDLKVDSAGIVFISSATDPGNDGPFKSALYVCGAFSVDGDRVIFRQNPKLVPLYHLDSHKVEGFDLVPGGATGQGGVIMGADDENMGASVYRDW